MRQLAVRRVLGALVFAALFVLVDRSDASNRPRGHAALVKKLARAVANPAFADSVLNNPQCRIDAGIAGRTKRRGYGYGYLLDSVRIARGRLFLREESELLWRVYMASGVEPEYLAAIYAAETDFGNFLGNHSVLPALYTRYFTVPQRKRHGYFLQLATFLDAAAEDGIDPFGTPSSSAGAWGLFQFMAISYRLFAVDWNGDGKRNLFELEDAAASAANFLRHHGWGSSDREKLRALRGYNGRRYANAVFRYANVVSDSVTPPPIERMEPRPFRALMVSKTRR